MSRRSPRALLLWFGAAAVAVITATVVASDLSTLHRRAQTLGPERAVAVATRDLPAGTTVSERDVTARRVHASQLPDGVLGPDDVQGRVVAVPILRDGFVTGRHLAPAERHRLDAIVPPGMRVVRLPDVGAPGIEPGVAVDVLATFDPAIELPDGWDPTITVAGGALVVNVANGPGTGSSSPGGAGVSVVVTEEEARGIAFALAHGVLTLAIAPPEDTRPIDRAGDP
jgi:pilus assembly protein CpaB